MGNKFRLDKSKRGYQMNKDEFLVEMRYMLGRFDWGNSPLDARAISFLNTWAQEFKSITESLPSQEDVVGFNKHALNGKGDAK